MKTIMALLFMGIITTSDADPSLKPLLDPTGEKKFAERSRIIVDLDGDGADDMLLSGSPDEFGKSGGPWKVYLKRGNEYKPVGEIWAHAMAIAFEPARTRFHTDPKTHRFARIWVYLRSSGSDGTLGYYGVGKDSVDEMVSLDIYPGDGGTALGNALYEATFKKSPLPFKMQTSRTAQDGTVQWPEH